MVVVRPHLNWLKVQDVSDISSKDVISYNDTEEGYNSAGRFTKLRGFSICITVDQSVVVWTKKLGTSLIFLVKYKSLDFNRFPEWSTLWRLWVHKGRMWGHPRNTTIRNGVETEGCVS